MINRERVDVAWLRHRKHERWADPMRRALRPPLPCPWCGGTARFKPRLDAYGCGCGIVDTLETFLDARPRTN